MGYINDNLLYDLGINSRHPCAERISNLYVAGLPVDDELLRNLAPSVFGDLAHASRSLQYKHISTHELISALKAHGYTVHGATQANTSDKEKSNFVMHMVILRNIAKEDFSRGYPEIFLINSHNGTSSWRMIAGWRHESMSILMPDEKFNVRIQHKGSEVKERVITSAEDIIKSAHEIDVRLTLMRERILSEREAKEFAQAALIVRFDTPESDTDDTLDDEDQNTVTDGQLKPHIKNYPVSVDRALITKDGSKGDGSVYSCMKILADNLINGEIKGIDASGKERKMKAIKNIGKKVALKQALFFLGEHYL